MYASQAMLQKWQKCFKEAMAANKDVTIMTDLTGQFNRVIMISKHENLTAYEESIKNLYESYSGNERGNDKNGRVSGHVSDGQPRNI